MKQFDAFGAETGDPKQIQESRWNGRDELLALRERARPDERRNLFCDSTPDPRQIGQIEVAAFHELRERIGVIRDGARGVAVRTNLEGIPLRNLQQVGDFSQQTSDVGVLHT
jgi:hypothetical protein